MENIKRKTSNGRLQLIKETFSKKIKKHQCAITISKTKPSQTYKKYQKQNIS